MIEFGRARFVMKLRPFAEKKTRKKKKQKSRETKVKRSLICVSWEDNHLRKII